MKGEIRESGVTLVPENEFDKKVLKVLRKHGTIIEKIHFEDDWEAKGKLYIDFSNDWGR